MGCTREGCTRPHYAKSVCITHYRADRRAAGIDPKRSRLTITKTCECCGVTFTADRHEARYCDRLCRDIANLLSGQHAAASLLGVASKPPAAERVGPDQCAVTFGHCAECGQAWAAQHGRPKAYCSPECRHRARAKRRGNRPQHHRRHADAIHERDGWLCWLCGEPTTQTWSKGDPLAPTIDHLIPQALGGGHEDSNLGTAHSICNSTRGARLITSLARVVALSA